MMIRALVGLLVLIAYSNSASAAIMLHWVGPNTAPAGSSIDVDLVLTETVTTNINDFGLAGASVTVTRNNTGTITSFSGSPLGAAEFDFQFAATGGDPVVSLEQLSVIGAGIGSSSVIVGHFTINSPVAGNGFLSVGGFNGTMDDLSVYTDALGTTLDFGDFSAAPTFSYSFTSSGVPEPTSFALVLVGLSVISLRRILHRKSRACSATSVTAIAGLRH